MRVGIGVIGAFPRIQSSNRVSFGWYARTKEAPEPFQPPIHQITYQADTQGKPVLTAQMVDKIARDVYRSRLEQSGYSKIRVKEVPDEQAFGQFVYALGQALGQKATDYGEKVFSPVWFHRRTFLKSTLPHQDMQYYDGIYAPQRIAILAYPPSAVRSQLFVADVAQACRDESARSDILLQQTLNNSSFWKRYTRPVETMSHKHWEIVVLNDSETYANSQNQLGVAHHAQVDPKGHLPTERVFFQLVLRPDPQRPQEWVPIAPDKLELVLTGEQGFKA